MPSYRCVAANCGARPKYFFFPWLALLGVDLQQRSVRYLLTYKHEKYRALEVVLMGVHDVLYFGMVFSCLNLWQGLLFLVVHQALFGIFLDSAFAPNHQGMLVLTLRSVRGGFLIDSGMSLRKIGEELGLARGTVRKYFRQAPEPPLSTPRPLWVSKLDPYEDDILTHLSQGCLNTHLSQGCLNEAQIHREITDMGFSHAMRNEPHCSAGSLYLFVQRSSFG